MGLSATLARSDPGGRLAPLGMRRVEIRNDALDLLPACISDLLGGITPDARVLLVTDSTRIERAGEDLKGRAWRMLSGIYANSGKVVVGAGRPKLYADEEAIAETEAAVAGADCVVVVGSGTITDICKVATSRTENDSALVVVQTAASVDGFSDDVSVILKSGVKRTVPSRWPEVLLSDLVTIAEAPPEMTAAGYGDAVSMYTAPADWRLASIMGIDESYHPAPVEMLLKGGPNVIKAAEEIGKREPDAVEKLVRLLALRGIASGVSGSTAILSGAEHVVSHMLDLYAGQTETPVGIHGAQVGAATVVIAAAWRTFLENFDPADVDIEACFPGTDKMESVVRGAFEALDSTGTVGSECWSDYRQKLSHWHESRDRFEIFLQGWLGYRSELERLVAQPEDLSRSLTLVGAPARFGELQPLVSSGTVRWALLNCHFMRNRFNVVDLLYFLGWWTPEFVEGLLERVDGYSSNVSEQSG